MRLAKIRVSGFKLIPFCAKCSSDEKNLEVEWQDPFELDLPIDGQRLGAIIGPNSSGKSTILQAISVFFQNPTKLGVDQFNGQQADGARVIIEATFRGKIPADSFAKHEKSCNHLGGDEYELTLARVFTTEDRKTYVRVSEGHYIKGTIKEADELLPEFRFIAGDARLSDQVNAGKTTPFADLIGEVLSCEASQSNRSIVYKIRNTLSVLRSLVNPQHYTNSTAWKAIHKLEDDLSQGIQAISPVQSRVRVDLQATIPRIEDLFKTAQVRVDDGVDLGFDDQGLGIQRSLTFSALYVWQKTVAERVTDRPERVFAIEEPELYLHPHATRFVLRLLERLAETDQVLFTTHSSEFVNRVPLENVRRMRRNGSCCCHFQPDLSGLDPKNKMKVERYLREDRSDMLFARAVLLVEGQGEWAAIPRFAETLGVDLDSNGVSVVWTNGKGNFTTYHLILEAFGIPHVILGDGDGERQKHQQSYANMIPASRVFVLERDFEYLIATSVKDKRLLGIVNESRQLKDQDPVPRLAPSAMTPANLKAHWWEALKEKLHSDIPVEYRDSHKADFADIQGQLSAMAKDVAGKGHTSPTAPGERRAAILKNEGKVLVGLVAGETLSRNEIEGLVEIASAIRKVCELV